MNLFEPDTHNSDTPSIYYKDCSLYEPIIEIALKHYRNVLPKSHSAALIGGPNMNSLNFRLDGFFLKILKSDQITDRLQSFPALSEALKANGIPSAPLLVNTEGEKITYFNIQGIKYAAIVQPFYDHQFYSGNRESLMEMLSIIEAIQSVFRDVRPTADHFIPYKTLEPSKVLESTREILLYKQKSESLDFFDNTIIEHMPQLTEISDFFKSNSGQLALSELHHYDLHPHNLLFESDKLSCVLDLDNIAIVDGRIAKGFNLFKVGRKALVKKHISLTDFKKITNDIFPMNDLKNFALVELLQRFLILMDFRYWKNNNLRDNELSKYTAAIKEIEIMFTP